MSTTSTLHPAPQPGSVRSERVARPQRPSGLASTGSTERRRRAGRARAGRFRPIHRAGALRAPIGSAPEVIAPVRACSLDAATQGRSDHGVSPHGFSATGLSPDFSAQGLSAPVLSGRVSPRRAVRTVELEPRVARQPSSTVSLTRRGRVVAVVALLLLTFTALSIGRVSGATTGSVADTAVVYETVVVQPGDSLWQIARDAAPDVDPRSTIARIVALNDLPADGSVQAGEEITVPTAPSRQ